jgi:hypothetical protein
MVIDSSLRALPLDTMVLFLENDKTPNYDMQYYYRLGRGGGVVFVCMYDDGSREEAGRFVWYIETTTFIFLSRQIRFNLN